MKYSEQILFVLSSGALYHFAGTNEYDDVKNRYMGVFGIIAFLCVVNMLRPYDGPFKNNQWIWRFLFQITIVYNAALVYLSFQNEKEARYLMSLADSRLGVPVTKEFHTYDDNCEFLWVNVYDNIDHYYLTHCINWFMVSLLLRDAWILNIWSLYDELLELTWQHILPHFRECWWDHVILDVLLSNTIFLFLGLWVSKKYGIDQYDWLGRKNKSFFQWEFWTKYLSVYIYSYHHFGGVMGIMVIITFNFLDGFFLMNSLWMPPVCWMPPFRIFTWFLIANNAFKEHWSSLEGKKVSGQMRFICIWTMMIETFVSVKFLKDCGNIQDVITPNYILYPWIVFIVASASYYLFLRFLRSDARPYIGVNEKPTQNHKLKSS